MASTQGTRNTASFEMSGSLPRMVSDADVALVGKAAQTLPSGSVAVEFGPWLGAFSEVIAPHAQLHVVDQFEWTKDHAKRVPGLLEPGESFRPVLERVLGNRGLAVEFHECAFDQFVWSGAEVGLVVIDGPKNASDLADCLRPVLPSLGNEARVLIKNALHFKYWEPAALLKALVDEDVLRPIEGEIPASLNMLELVAGQKATGSVAVPETADVVAPVDQDFLDQLGLGTDHPYRIAPILRFIETEDFSSAYHTLSRMTPDRRMRRVWEKHVPRPTGSGPATIFADVFAFHHTAVARSLPEPFHSSPERLLRGAWLNMADQPDRGQRFRPEIMDRARDYGYMSWPSKVRTMVLGKDVLDVGCGPGLHGLGYLAAGASSYMGVDPIIRTDKDRVKDLSRGDKSAFGWTPDEISALIPGWDVLPIGVEDLPDDRSFDLVVMHNVTEHLPDLESAFEGISRVLRRGGHILYNHDNYYSWNGHHCPPKRVSEFDPSDPAQLELVDWGHIEFDPPPDHYIARGLNRITLDGLIALTERFFKIVQKEEVPSSPSTGIDRLTDDILARHPKYTRRDLTTKNLFCLARKS